MSRRTAISEPRNVKLSFVGSQPQLEAPVDSYKAALEVVVRTEGAYQKIGSAISDLTDATVLATGANPNQIHVFTVTTVLANADYKFVYVETKPNAES